MECVVCIYEEVRRDFVLLSLTDGVVCDLSIPTEGGRGEPQQRDGSVFNGRHTQTPHTSTGSWRGRHTHIQGGFKTCKGHILGLAFSLYILSYKIGRFMGNAIRYTHLLSFYTDHSIPRCWAPYQTPSPWRRRMSSSDTPSVQSPLPALLSECHSWPLLLLVGRWGLQSPLHWEEDGDWCQVGH